MAFKVEFSIVDRQYDFCGLGEPLSIREDSEQRAAMIRWLKKNSKDISKVFAKIQSLQPFFQKIKRDGNTGMKISDL